MPCWSWRYCPFNPPTCTLGTFFIQVDAPFETIRYCGFEWWNNCIQCWFPKWFWMVGQLIPNLVWIFPNGSTANTKPCLDISKWWINGTFKTIWMVVQLAKWYHHVCTKPMGILESGNFEWFQMVYRWEGYKFTFILVPLPLLYNYYQNGWAHKNHQWVPTKAAAIP